LLAAQPSLSTPAPAPIKHAQPAAVAQTPPVDPRRPYGGLVATTSRAPRAYADAAAYNQQLNQHQTQVAQQQAAQAAASVYRHPFAPSDDASVNYSNQQRLIQQQQQQQLQAQHAHAMSQQQQQQHTLRTSASSSGLGSTPYTQRKSSGSILPLPAAVHHSGQPSNVYYQQPTGRSRANTINQMDLVPAAIARVTQLGVDPGGGRSPLTPVMNREEMMREWERRQQQQQNGAAGKRASVNQPWQLEYLEGQAAELGGWGHMPSTQRFGLPPSGFVPPPQPLSVIVDDGSGRNSHQTDDHRGFPSSPAGASIMSPPQAYSGASARYPAYPSQGPSSYDAYDHRDGLATLVQPLQPQQSYDPRHAPAATQHSQLNPFASGHGPPSGSQQQQQLAKRQSTAGNDGWH
jgi:dual specificity protein kinase YAK1